MSQDHPTSNPNLCEECGKPATQWVLVDPFGKSDAKKPLCGEHGMRLRDPADVAEIERLLAALERIKRIGPLGVDTYPECYRRMHAIAEEALSGEPSAHETATKPVLCEPCGATEQNTHGGHCPTNWKEQGRDGRLHHHLCRHIVTGRLQPCDCGAAWGQPEKAGEKS